MAAAPPPLPTPPPPDPATNASEWWNLLERLEHDPTDPQDVGAPPTSPTEEPVKEVRCFHCANSHLTNEASLLICTSCDTVVSRLIDTAAEWRMYVNDDSRGGGGPQSNPARCGPANSEFMSSVGSSICRVPRGAGGGGRGVQATAHGQCASHYLQKYHAWNTLTHRDRALMAVFDTLSVLAANNGITPCILSDAKWLYKRISEVKASRGDNRRAIIACSIYMACKQGGVPRSLKEIAVMFNVPTAALTKACKAFQEIMDVAVVSSSPFDFITRFCTRLGLHPDVMRACTRAVQAVLTRDLAPSCTPPTLVASIIVFCCTALNVGVTREDVAAVAQVTPCTMTKILRELGAHLEVLLDALSAP